MTPRTAPAGQELGQLSGDELADRLVLRALERGMYQRDFLAPLSANAEKWLAQLRRAQRPRAAALARIGALLADEPVPAPPEKAARRARGPGATNAAVVETLPPRVDRDPCFRCGVRGDIGCAHQRVAA